MKMGLLLTRQEQKARTYLISEDGGHATPGLACLHLDLLEEEINGYLLEPRFLYFSYSESQMQMASMFIFKAVEDLYPHSNNHKLILEVKPGRDKPCFTNE